MYSPSLEVSTVFSTTSTFSVISLPEASTAVTPSNGLNTSPNLIVLSSTLITGPGISSPSPNLVISKFKSLVANPIASSLLLKISGLFLFSSVGSIWIAISFLPTFNFTSCAKLPFSSTTTGSPFIVKLGSNIELPLTVIVSFFV